MNGSDERFMGWFTDFTDHRSFATEWNPAYHRMPGHDMTIFARWGGFRPGEQGPGGGLVLYARDLHDPFTLFQYATDMVGVDAWYLEAAPNYLEPAALLHNPWLSGMPGGLERSIGTGKRNTDIFYQIFVVEFASTAYSPAARAVRAFDSGDWFIPSLDELMALIYLSDDDDPISTGVWTTSSRQADDRAYQVYEGSITNMFVGNTNTRIWPVRAW
jgi:hypothetical protein